MKLKNKMLPEKTLTISDNGANYPKLQLVCLKRVLLTLELAKLALTLDRSFLLDAFLFSKVLVRISLTFT